jgi:hypothetical protein
MSEPLSLYVSDTAYGRRKAKNAAQAEANRLGRKVYLQLVGLSTWPARELLASITVDRVAYMGLRWFTYYPAVSKDSA